jgi:hypothetical protein
LFGPLRLISVFVCVVLVVGVLYRRRKRVHIPLMLSAFAIDLGIVIYIEVNRGAFATAQSKMGPLMIVHITFSVVALVCYFIQFFTGIANARGKRSLTHAKVWPWLLVSRFGNLVTSFMVMN